jgi:hypothetical protein
LAAGVLAYYAYLYARWLLSPVMIYLGSRFVDPYAETVWLQTLVLNLFASTLSGAVGACFGILLLHYVVRPRSMKFPQIGLIAIVIASYWWFVIDAAGYMERMGPGMAFQALVSPIALMIVWLPGTMWLVGRNKRLGSCDAM